MDMVEYTTDEDRLTRTKRTPNTLSQRNQFSKGGRDVPLPPLPVRRSSMKLMQATSLIEFNYRDYGVSTNSIDKLPNRLWTCEVWPRL